jgi:hypothetical protein
MVRVPLLVKQKAPQPLQFLARCVIRVIKPVWLCRTIVLAGTGMGKSFSHVSKLDGAFRTAERHFDQLWGDAYVQALQD